MGLLYCSGEPNSVYQVTTIQGYLEEMGYTCEQYAFTDVNDLSSVAQTACDGSDVIYIPTDNTAAANTETIANVVIPAGVPLLAARAASAPAAAWHPVHQLLRSRLHHRPDGCPDPHGEADISTMPIEYAPNVTPMYNAANCEALNLTMPEGYEPIA